MNFLAYKSIKQAIPYYVGFLIAILTPLFIRMAFTWAIVYAQSMPIRCPSADELKIAVKTLSSMILAVIIIIIIIVVMFNALGAMSDFIMRIGEFFITRIRFLVDFIIIYIMFLWNFNPDQTIHQSGECAYIDYDTLFQSGPLFFRILGYLLHLLGLWQ